MSILNEKNNFPIFDNNEGLIYLDNAATTQKPDCVIEAMYDYYRHFNANVGRSVYSLSMKAHQAYEDSRERLKRFINSPSKDNIVFTKGTTEGINFIAQSFARKRLKPGDEVLVTGMEHHSNLLPWQTVCQQSGAVLRVVPINEHGLINLGAFEALLSDKTRMVAAAHVSNVLGITNPVREMIRLAHDKNIPVLLDGAQAIAHMAVDVQELEADFYCFSGHKMYGPMGIGVLYISSQYLQNLDVFQTGGGVAFGVNYERVTDYMPPPYRYEAGTPNIAGAIGLARAADYLTSVGMSAVREHEQHLFFHAMKRLGDISGLKVLGPHTEPSGIISFIVDGIHPYDVGNHLNQFNVAVRTGVHCSIPTVDSLQVLGTVRMSFGVYNALDDIDQAVEALNCLVPMDWTKERPNSRFMS